VKFPLGDAGGQVHECLGKDPMIRYSGLGTPSTLEKAPGEGHDPGHVDRNQEELP
jgi:hypothetical protein